MVPEHTWHMRTSGGGGALLGVLLSAVAVGFTSVFTVFCMHKGGTHAGLRMEGRRRSAEQGEWGVGERHAAHQRGTRAQLGW